MAHRLIPLQDLGQVTQGINPKRYASQEGDDFPIVSVRDLENLLIYDTEAHDQLSIPDPKRYQLQENDVVIAIRGSLLKSSVVTSALQGSISNQNTVFFRPAQTKIDPIYLAALFRSGYVEQLPSFRDMSSTTTLPAIRVGDLRNLEIPLPSLEAQLHISKLFVSLDRFIQLTLSSTQIRQALAQSALFKAIEELNS
jgi:restriction endonuclease S subunit